MSKNTIKFERVHDNAVIPQKATPQSAGYDLHSVEDLTIYPSMRRTVSTALRGLKGRSVLVQALPSRMASPS
jgi:dUTPase